MQIVQLGSIERLTKQGELLARTYQAELSQDPTSQAAQSSRSNLIALQHTAEQMYGKAVALVSIAKIVEE